MDKLMMYREGGFGNWYLCKVIAEYEDKIWLHNLHVGSMPVKRRCRIQMKPAGDYLREGENNE